MVAKARCGTCGLELSAKSGAHSCIDQLRIKADRLQTKLLEAQQELTLTALPFIVLVCGGRAFSDRNLMHATMTKVRQKL